MNGIWATQAQSYDAFGQTKGITKRLSATKTVSYSYDYDLAGNKTEATLPFGDNESLTTEFTYDELSRLVSQSDPFNPGHMTKFTYLPEGQQETRTEYKDDVAKRRIETTYNDDYTVRAMIATDLTATPEPTVADCNWIGTDASSGYDANGNLTDTRTVIGGSGCEGGETVRTRKFIYDQRDWLDTKVETVQGVERTQRFTYRDDGVLSSSTWDGRTTEYDHSTGGFMESVDDWRPEVSDESTFSYVASGALTHVRLASGDATAQLEYHRDGSLARLAWDTPDTTAPVRAHEAIRYDEGGLKLDERVSIVAAEGQQSDTAGPARFDYDLGGRLSGWTSPFPHDPKDAASDGAKTTYELDDAGNIELETVRSTTGSLEQRSDPLYRHGRLESRAVTDPQSGYTYEADETYTYSALGEETRRETNTVVKEVPDADIPTRVTTTSYDSAGRTDEVTTPEEEPDVDYLYSASGQLIARVQKGASVTEEDKTKRYFYFGTSSTIAEETTATGTTKVRYLVSSGGDPLAKQTYDSATDASSEWVWLLQDADGNVGTELRADGKVLEQKAYDPYGSPDLGGSSKAADEDNASGTSPSPSPSPTATGPEPTQEDPEAETEIGFQMANTDQVTGNVLLGPRQYDPETERFTSADTFVASGVDMQLGSDPLTGNRYLFAAANPVAFYENGYVPTYEGGGRCPCHHGDEAGSQAPRSAGAFRRFMGNLIEASYETYTVNGGNDPLQRQSWNDDFMRAAAQELSGFEAGRLPCVPDAWYCMSGPEVGNPTDPVEGRSGWRRSLVDNDSNPARHFVGWLATGYFRNSRTIALAELAVAERQGRLGSSNQDVRLGEIGISLGVQLQRQEISQQELISSLPRLLGNPRFGGALQEPEPTGIHLPGWIPG